MSPLLTDTRLAIRYLCRHPVFAGAAIGILGLGIGLCAALFAIVKATLIEPWPYAGADRIVTFTGSYPTQHRTDYSLWSVPEIEDFRAATDIFEQVIAGDARNVNLTYAGRPERVQAAVITSNAFAMLGVPAQLGRTLEESDAAAGAEPVAVVSFQFWRTRLGADRDAVGRTLRVADVPHRIVGVMPERFVFWGRDIWMPLRLDPSDARGDRRWYVQARLVPGLPIDQAAIRLRILTRRMAADHPETPEYAGFGIVVKPLLDNVLRELRPTLYLLVAAVALVLIVATANLANATLAQGLAREGELAIRRALGGSSLQLARQLLVESSMVGLAGGIAGGAIGAFALPAILSLIPFGYVPAEAHVEMDWRVVALCTLCAIACGLLVGVLPALRAAAVDPGTLLKQGDTRTGSRRSHRWRDALVVAQLTLAVLVLGLASAAAVNLSGALGRDPGYRAAGIFTARVALRQSDTDPAHRARTYDNILQRLQRNAAVSNAAAASVFPAVTPPTALVYPEGAQQSAEFEAIDAAVVDVSPRFFELLTIPVNEGRVFADSDAPGRPPVAVVTRALATRLAPIGGLIGRRITIAAAGVSAAATVVGIVGDLTTATIGAVKRPTIFLPIAQHAPVAAAIGLQTSDPVRALAAIDAAVRDVDAELPVYQPETLQQARVDALGPQLLAVTLLGVFAASVLAVSALGVYAVVSQSVGERALELRIRLTFGASPPQLFAGELTRSAKLIAMSVAGGLATAVAALRWLAAAFEGFGGAAAWPLAISSAALVGVALAATAVPAWRACQLRAPLRT
jgi:predicted permease